MNELRAHPYRLLAILAASLMAFTTTYAVGSYSAVGAPAANQAPAVSDSADPSQPPVIETPKPSPAGSTPASVAPSGGGADGGSDEGGATATAPTTGQADEPEPTRQPAEHTTAPAPAEPQPAPATSTAVVTPSCSSPNPEDCAPRCGPRECH